MLLVLAHTQENPHPLLFVTNPNPDGPRNRLAHDMVHQMKRDVGTDVTVLVQNAGIVAGKPFLEGEDTYSQRTMEVNAMAHFWTIKVRHSRPGRWVCRVPTGEKPDGRGRTGRQARAL